VAYNIRQRWTAEDIDIVLVDEASEGDVITVRVSLGGAALLLMGEIKEDGKRLVASGVHISSEGVNPNEIGVANLRRVARAVMEVGRYDEIIVEGAVRTTGAPPRHRPGSLRFFRDRLFAAHREARSDKDR
jgi:hypothetical protein